MNSQEKVTVELDYELVEAINRLSKEGNLTFEEYVNTVLKEHIEENNSGLKE